MVRILQVVPYYAPAWAYGGPPKVMWEEARALRDLGHDITVFTTDAFDDDSRVAGQEHANEDGLEIHRFRNLSNWLAYHQYRFTPRGFFKAMKTVETDAIHLSEMRHELAIGAWSAARRRDIPLFVSAHGTLPRREGAKAIVRRAYDVRFVTPMVENAAGLLAQTNHEAALYADFGGRAETIHLLPLGTEPPPPPTDDPPDLGVPEGARVVLFLGRIHRLKGVDRLLHGFAQMAKSHDDTYLVVAGRDDGDLARTQQLAATLGIGERVRFPGPIYGAARYDAYRRADVFAITPTHFEETSLASLEAASVGTALLVSEEAEVPFLADYGAGRTARAGEDVAPLLDELLKADLETTGANAKRMIDERHLWSVVGTTLSTIIEKAITARP